jgi:hypothetical protein
MKMDKIKELKLKFESLEKKKKITILIGLGLFIVLFLNFMFSENDEKMAKNFSEKRELEVSDVSSNLKNVDFKYDLKEGSIKKDFLKLKKSQEFLLQKLNDLSINGIGNNNINKNLSSDSNGKFNIKSNIFYGYSFINNDEYYISVTGGSVIKSLSSNNTKGPNNKEETGNGVINISGVTPMIFIYDTNVYTMANGDEFYFSSNKKIKITSKSLFKNIKEKEKYIKEKSIKSVKYKQGTYILIDKYNEVVEEGNFSIYFFKGKKFVLDNGFKNVATPIQNLEIYKPTQKLFKSFKIIDDNVNVVSIENNNLYLNDALYVKGSEKLFVEEQTHKILITKDKTFYIVKNTFNIGYLEKYIDDLGAIYKLDSNGVIYKYNLDGTNETIGNGYILLRNNGEISIKLNNKANILTLDSSLSNKLKIVTCVNTDKKVYIHNKNISIKIKNKVSKKYTNATHVFKDDYLYIDNIKICKIKSIVIRNTGNGLELEDGATIKIHDLNRIDKNKIYVTDKDGNRYYEKDGVIYRINPDGSITKIGKGTINEDGSITMADGTKLETYFEDKDGNRYIKKDGKIFRINPDGSLEEVKTLENTRIVVDEEGNRYFEKDGVIYRINPDGSITKMGKGKINVDGSISMEDGSSINTFDLNDKNLVADEFGNKYFEKDGVIYRINPDGSITKIGKGKINPDGTISMADGTKILTKNVKKVVMDKDGNKYFEKDGKIYKIDKNGNIIELGKGKVNADGSITMADGVELDTFKIKEGKAATDIDGNQYFIKDGIIYKKSKDGTITKMGKGKISADGTITLADGTKIKTFDIKDGEIIIDEEGNKYYEKDGVIYRVNPDGSITKIGKGQINTDGSISMADGTKIDTKRVSKIVVDKDGNKYFEKDGVIYRINPDGSITKIGKGKINPDGSISMADGTKIDTFDLQKKDIIMDEKGNKYYEKDGVIYRVNPDGSITKMGKGKINADGTITMADGTKINTKKVSNIVSDKDGNKYIEKDGVIYRINPDGSITKIGKGKINTDGSISMADGTKIDTFDLTQQKVVIDKDGNKYFEKDGVIYRINPDGSITKIGKGKINTDGSISMADGTKIDTFDMIDKKIVIDKDGNKYFEKDGVIYRINPDGSITEIGKGKINPDGSITMADGTKIDTKVLRKVVTDKNGNKYFEKDGVIYKINPDGSITEVGKGKISEDGTIIMTDGSTIKTFDLQENDIIMDEKGNKYYEKDGVIYKINPDGSITKIGKGKINADGTITMADGTKINTKKVSNIVIDKDGNKYIEKDGVIYKVNPDGSITKIGRGKINSDGSITMADGTKIDTFDLKNTKFVIDKDGNKYFEKDGVIYRVNPDGSITEIGRGKINSDGSISMADGTKIDTFDVNTQKIFTDKDGNKYFEKDGVIYRVNPDGSITKMGKGRIDKDGNIYFKDGTIIKAFDTDKAAFIDAEGNKYFEKDGIIYKIGKDGKIIKLGKGKINKNGDILMENGKIIKTKSIYKPSNKYNVNFWGEAIFTDSKKDVSITRNNRTTVVKNANIEVKNEEVFIFKYLIFKEKYNSIDSIKKNIFNDYSNYQHLSFDNGILKLNFEKFKPKFIENSKIKILGDKLYLLKNNKEVYSDLYKNKSSIDFTNYKMENQFLKLFSINDKKILKLGGDFFLLEPNKYIIEIDEDKQTISIKEKIIRSNINNATVEESAVDTSYFKYENGVLKIYQNGVLIKTITDPVEINKYFNMNKETYEYKLDVPTLLNDKLIVYTETGEIIEYKKKGQIVFIKKDGTKIDRDGNIYIQQGDKIILKYAKKTLMFKIKKLIIKKSSIFRTEKGTYAVNNRNIIYKSTGKGDFEIQKGFQEAFIKNNIVYITGIEEIKLGEFISISSLKLKLNDNASIITKVVKPVIEKPVTIIKQDNSLNKEVLLKLKALNDEIMKLKQRPTTQAVKTIEKKQVKLFNKDLYDLSDKELDELFKPDLDPEGNPLPTSYTLPSIKSQSISKEAKAKLAKKREIEIKAESFTAIRFPIGTVIVATIPSAYEVKTIVGGEEAGGLKTPFIANNIENVKLPDGNVVYFPEDALLRGDLIGDAVTERVIIVPKDIVWYDGDTGQYMQMAITASITYSDVENIEGIPGLFINKKIESVVMTSGLQLVSGIAEAIISASSPLASLGGAGDVAGLTGGGAGEDSADKSKVQGAAIGGASKAFDEIIGLIKSDMKKLISFIVTNEEEKIRIIITEDTYTATR